MKVQIELDIDLSAKAVYRNGKLVTSVSGSMPYGNNRVASASVRGASEEVEQMFIDAFEALLQEIKEKAVAATQAARSESFVVATRMGEL